MTGPVRVVLVRHGSVDAAGRCYGQRHDPPLDDAGRREVGSLAARLRAVVPSPALERPHAVISSPARRALETAASVSDSPRVDPRWAERDFGDWEGRPWDECWEEVGPEVHASRAAYAAFTPPGGETLDDVRERVVEALDDATSASEEDTVVVVTHGGPIRAVVGSALGLTAPAHFALSPGYATVTELVRWGDSWVLERFGA